MDIAVNNGLMHTFCSQSEETPRADGYVCSSDIPRQSRIAADTLQALLTGGERPQNHVLITPTLVIRESA